MKKCSICGEEFPATTKYFYKRSLASDGLQSQCKICHKKRVNGKNHEYRKARIKVKNSDLYNLTIKTIGAWVKATGIRIMPGEAYNLYVCGCLINHSDDPISYAYFPNLGYVNRTCPNHKPSGLVNKYKICGGCGTEYFSDRVQASVKCSVCYGVKNGEKKKEKNKSLKNAKYGDPERGDCIHRSECGYKYMYHQAIPCKGCKMYKKEHYGLGNYHETTRQYGSTGLNSAFL